jgi:hypothetical protein
LRSLDDAKVGGSSSINGVVALCAQSSGSAIRSRLSD